MGQVSYGRSNITWVTSFTYGQNHLSNKNIIRIVNSPALHIPEVFFHNLKIRVWLCSCTGLFIVIFYLFITETVSFSSTRTGFIIKCRQEYVIKDQYFSIYPCALNHNWTNDLSIHDSSDPGSGHDRWAISPLCPWAKTEGKIHLRTYTRRQEECTSSVRITDNMWEVMQEEVSACFSAEKTVCAHVWHVLEM